MDKDIKYVFSEQYSIMENAVANSFIIECTSISARHHCVDAVNFIKYMQRYPELPVYRETQRVIFDEEEYSLWFDGFLEEQNSRLHILLKTIYRHRKKELENCDGKIRSIVYICGEIRCDIVDGFNKALYNVACGYDLDSYEAEYYNQALKNQSDYETVNKEITNEKRESILALNEQANKLGDILSKDPEYRKCTSYIKKWEYLIHYITHNKDDYSELYWWKDIDYSANNPTFRTQTSFLNSITRNYYEDFFKEVFEDFEDE